MANLKELQKRAAKEDLDIAFEVSLLYRTQKRLPLGCRSTNIKGENESS